MATESQNQAWEIIKTLSYDEFKLMQQLFAPAKDED
jgi:hypothetical protein